MENNNFFESSDITFENILDEVNPTERVDEVKDVDITPETPTTDLPVEAKQVDVNKDEGFDKLNDLTLAAAYLREEGLIELEDLEGLTTEKFAEALKNQRVKESQTYRDQILEQAGEYRNYFELKLNGVDQDIIDDIAEDTLVSKLKLDVTPEEESDNTIMDGVERNREIIIASELSYKGVPEKDHASIIKGHKDNGTLKERALESKEFFDKEESARTQYEIEQNKYREQQVFAQREGIRSEINKYITGKKIAGYNMSDQESRELKQFIFEQNASIETVDENNRRIAKKASSYDRELIDFQNSIESQLAFALWLMKGKNFTAIKNQGGIEQHNSILSEIKKRSTPRREEEVVDHINELINYR